MPHRVWKLRTYLFLDLMLLLVIFFSFYFFVVSFSVLSTDNAGTIVHPAGRQQLE